MYIPGVWSKPFTLIKFLIANIALSLVVIQIFMPGAFQVLNTFLVAFFWSFSICITQWSGLGLVHTFLDRKISWIEAPVKKTFVLILVFLLYSISAFILVQLFNYYVWLGVVPSKSWALIIQSVPYTLLISLVMSLIFTAIGFFHAWKNSFVQAEKLKVEMMAYKYESLRNQINPHFLFNSLNVLSGLVYEDQAMAVKFIQQMSDLFRYVLDSREKELVPLNDELEFIRSFTFLLKTRFEDKLLIENDVESNPDEFIVPMTLQLLIENAVKHNEVSETFPLRISIRKDKDYLEIENNRQPKNAAEDSTKTGLHNIIQQFAFFSDLPIEIIPSDTKFRVRVPILKSLKK
jgi:two-component system LytT family sensor kinase